MNARPLGAAIGLLLLAAGALGPGSVAVGRQGSEHGGRAVDGGGREHGGSGMAGSMARQRYVMRNGLPDAYRSRQNPLSPTAERVARGRETYQTYCASCHGPDGRGDGPAAAGLDPRPADLVRAVRRPVAGDAYLYWTIAEGGAPVGSAMPAYGSVLDLRTAWELILYLRRM